MTSHYVIRRCSHFCINKQFGNNKHYGKEELICEKVYGYKAMVN